MANTIFKLRRSSVAGKVPNTSTVAIGELAINLTDKILYSSDGSAVFEIGANNTNVNISNNLIIANVTTANTSGLYSTKQLYGNTLTVATNTFTVGNTFYIVSNGNVGIGTGNNFNWDNSTTFLTIGSLLLTGSGVTDGAGSGIEIGQWRTGNGAAYIDFHSAYGNDLDARIIKASGANGTFSIQNGANGAISIDTSSVNRVFVSGNGNIGIGNSTPEHKLRVQGTASVTGNLSLETTSGLILANGVGVSLNGSLGVNGQVLATNGSSAYWFTPIGGVLPIQQQYTANGSATSFVVTGGYVPNAISVFLNGVMLRNGTEVDVTSGSTFTISPAPANGSLIDVVGPSRLYSTGVNSIVSQQFTANGTANSFAVTGGYISNSVLVFLNGVKQIPGTDVDISTGANVGFYSTPSNGFVVDVYGYQTYVALGSNAITVGSNLSIGADSITVGNSTVNTYITAGNIALNGSELRIGNSSVNTVINNISASLGTNTFTIGNTFYIVSNGNVGIACTSPDFKLDVHGSSSGLAASFEYDVGAGDCGIRIVGMRQGYDGDVSYLDLTNYNYSTPNTYVMGRISSGMDGSSGAGASNGNIKFKTSLNGTLTEAMRIGANGNVGISNATAADKLSVNGTTYLGGATTINGNTTITGNLIVTGTTFTVNTTTLDVKDLNITVAKGAGSAAAANGAGITVDAGYANLYYDSTANAWTSTVGLNISNGNFGIGTTNGSSYGFWATPNVAASNVPTFNMYGASSSSAYNAIYIRNIATDSTRFVVDWSGLVKTATGITTIGSTNLGLGTNAGTSSVTIDTSGNMGIGTASPSHQLTVYGAGQNSATYNTTSGTGGSIIVGDTGAGYGAGGAIVFSGGGTLWRYAAIKGWATNGTANSIGDLAFYTRNSTTDAALTEAMRINSLGNLSVGTASGSYKLNIFNSGQSIALINGNTAGSNPGGAWAVGVGAAGTIDGGIGSFSAIRGGASQNDIVVSAQNNNSLRLWTSGAYPIILEANNAEGMRVAANGNVGINSSSPSYKLDVNGNARIQSSLYMASGTWNYIGSDNTFWSSNTYGLLIQTPSSNNTLSLRKSDGTTQLWIDSSGSVMPGTDNAQNLGTASFRWANIYTGDLNLSNEGSGGNDVDGTTGSWTIQEGENDLYIINKKNGKKFKIKMEEIV